jgi:thioredoxin 1
MPGISEIQASNWGSEVVKAEGPVVVDFWHNMCAWCKKLNPIFAQLPEAIPGVKFLKVNILESPENRKVAIDSGVMGTPTIKVFCEGRPIGRRTPASTRARPSNPSTPRDEPCTTSL